MGLTFTSPGQLEVAQRFAAGVSAPLAGEKVGVALNVRSGLMPLNGLRHPPEEGTSGWYFWAGTDLSNEADFFIPIHIEHLADWCPSVIPYLALAPGWRFLIAPGYEDVWFDEGILHV